MHPKSFLTTFGVRFAKHIHSFKLSLTIFCICCCCLCISSKRFWNLDFSQVSFSPLQFFFSTYPH